MARVRKLEWDSKIKLIATVLSAGAALVSILSFVAGRRTAQGSPAEGLEAMAVTRIALAPVADTAFAIGDTLQFTTVATDARGQALHAAAVHWSVDDPSIAEIDSTGQVVARRAGATTVTVAIGGRAGRARVLVRPRLTFLAIVSDTVLQVNEGTALEMRAMGRDARGSWHRPDSLAWGGGDAEVAQVDSMGILTAVAPGRTTITASASGLVAQRRVLVRPVPASITLTAGAAQRAPAGQPLPAPVAVQVVSRSGRPVPGARVRFNPYTDLGDVDESLVTTDTLGVASARWTLGPTPGRQRLSVAVDGIDSAMTVIAEADPLPGNTVISVTRDSLAAEVGTALPAPLVVHVTDSAGLVLADLPVRWTVLDSGAIVPVDARTDSLGEATAHWTLGPRSGLQRARLQVGNPRTLPPIVVEADARPGRPRTIEVVSGGRQAGTVGSALKQPVVLRVLDSLGNGVGGVPVRLAATSGALDSVVETGPDGEAKVRWTLGESVGSARLAARFEAKGDSAAATATVRPGAPKTIVFSSAASSGTAGRSLATPVRIVVHDRYGNPVPKATVRFSVHSGKASPAQGVTDSAGAVMTKWTLGPKVGKQSLTATIRSPAVKAYHVITAQAPPAPKSRRTK